MIEPEVAYLDHEGNLELQEQFISHAIQTVLDKHEEELQLLERDTSQLEQATPPFPRITYDEALDIVQAKGLSMEWGDDFGTPHEEAIVAEFDKPVFVEKFPAKAKAFYMEPDPDRPEVVLAADLLAPEGYGEVIGGSQRIHDLDLLLQRIDEHELPREAFEWYIDLRRYGTVPHSGFGMGIERVISWICKLDHLREAIPFPRLLNRIYP
jgi:asparaginyl-tRNA synthetase